MDELEKAARLWARDMSSAPDKETPDWIITDFKAGANWAQNNMELKSKKLLEKVVERRHYVTSSLRKEILNHLDLPF